MKKKQIYYLIAINIINSIYFFRSSYLYQNNVMNIMRCFELGATIEKVTYNMFSLTIQTSLTTKTIINQPVLIALFAILFNMISIVGILIFNKIKED